MKHAIVIIGANNFQNPLILKAKELGYETHVFAWKDGAVGAETADHFYPISIINKEEILEICRKISPEGILSVGSDLAVPTVNYIAEKLGLVGNSAECTLISTNKFEMRRRLRKYGLPMPNFTLTGSKDGIDTKGFHYPLIVKPVDRSGSRGVTKVIGPDGLARAVQCSLDSSFEKKAIVEEYIDGPEYSAECISYQGEHRLLALTQKFTTGTPHFIETGHLQPVALDEQTVSKIVTTIQKGLDALGIKFGASHSEFRIKPDGSIAIIEIGSRMGGDCIGSDLVRLSTGYDFIKMAIDVACGNSPDFTKYNQPKIAFIRFIFDENDLYQLNRIKKVCPSAIYRISPIELPGSQKVTDSSTRLGYYILTCSSKKQLNELLQLHEGSCDERKE